MNYTEYVGGDNCQIVYNFYLSLNIKKYKYKTELMLYN